MSIHRNHHLLAAQGFNQPYSPKRQLKYNYLEHSFKKSLQRSYDRRSNSTDRNRSSEPHNMPTNYPHLYRSGFESPPRQSQLANKQHRHSQFSPYENNEDNVKQKLLWNQIKHQNLLLTQKLKDYEVMLEQVHLELKVKNEELSHLGQILQKQKLVNQQIVGDMKQEISSLLTKNTILETQKLKLLRQIETQGEKKRGPSHQPNDNILEQIKGIINQQNRPAEKSTKNKKRSSGKFMDYSFNNSFNVSPKKQNRASNQLDCPLGLDSSIMADLRDKIHRLRKFQELTDSILEMHHKIMGSPIAEKGQNCRGTELKSIWKWLKMLGHNFNVIKKWKKVLVDCIKQQGREDMAIEELFQKIAISFHE